MPKTFPLQANGECLIGCTCPDIKLVAYATIDVYKRQAETIGRVSVVDRGTSTNCRYDQVLHLAQEATGKIGGNGLAITNHQKRCV